MPGHRRCDRRRQPRVVRGPARLRPVRLRLRPVAAVPRQGRAVPGLLRRPRAARGEADPGQPRHRRTPQRSLRTRGGRRSSAASASASTRRARSPGTPTSGRCGARPGWPGWRWPPTCRWSRWPSGGRSSRRRPPQELPAAPAQPATARRRAGRPVRLPGRRPLTAELLREITDLIMVAVRDLLAEIRGETPPPTFHLRAGARGRPGRPRLERCVTRAAVLGAGSWGTTFAKVLADAGGDVTLWARRPELVAVDRRAAREPGLPARRAAAAGARAPPPTRRRRWTAPTSWCSRVPSQTLRDNLAGWAPGG